LIHLKAQWAYGKEGNPKFNIPPNADVDFEIHLKDFEKAKQSWEMEDDEKLDLCEKWKQRGSEFFQQGKNKLAIVKYNSIVEYLQNETSLDGEKKHRRDNILTAAHNNLAMVYLKTNDTVEAIKECEKVFEVDAKNVKALYRWAQAYQNQNDFDEAIKGYDRVLELEPGNKAAQTNIVQCRSRLVDERKREKALFANMFDKLAKSDKSHIIEPEDATKPENGFNSESDKIEPMNVDDVHSNETKA